MSEESAVRAGAMERVDGAGVKLAVRRRAAPRARQGLPRQGLMLLHGWPGTHLDWSLVLDRLARNAALDSIELICPDLRGFGASDKPDSDAEADQPWAAYSPAAHLEDLIAVLDRLEIEELIAGGYDLGANLAQGLARAQPARVRGLVLCDPVHAAARAQAAKLDLAPELWYQAFHRLPWCAQLVGHDRSTVEVYLRHFYTHWWGKGEVQEDHFQAVVDAYAEPGSFEASIGWYRARAAVRNVAAPPPSPLVTPTRILWGVRDPVTPVVLADTLDQSFAKFELTRLPDIGHFAPLEAPDDVATAALELAVQMKKGA